MPALPALDKNVNNSPHVVILGAGASLAACPNGDIQGKKLPLMKDLVEILGLEEDLVQHGVDYDGKNFELIYNSVCEENNRELKTLLEKKVRNYFSYLKIPKEPTIYDYLVTSLREKDLIASFNWDPLLLQAYARNAVIRRLPRLALLHGNVAVAACFEDKVMGRNGNLCSKCKKPLIPIPLLYPIKNKDYEENLAIAGEWDTLKNYLKHAYMVTIFGYSAPKNDESAKKALLEAWTTNKTLPLAEIEIISKRSKEELEATWGEFIFEWHYHVAKDYFTSYLNLFPRRSCDAFAAQTLQCEPWNQNMTPKFSNLEELHKWLEPLLKDEESYESEGKPFTYKTESNWKN